MAQMSFNAVTPSLLRLEPFRGIDVSGTSTQIDDHQSPDMLNMNIDERGSLNKRTGYERVYSDTLGPGKINGIYEYKKSNSTTEFLIAHTTKLYKQSGNNQPVLVYTGLADANVHFFSMNYTCYILDGANFLVYDGIQVRTHTAYVPTIQMSKDPAGGGTAYEDFNLIGNLFKDSFSGDGTATVYKLSLNNLDSTPVTATIGTSIMAEGSGFTVDRLNGKVTFTTAPAKGTNNVIIQAGKTVSGFPEKIKNCTFSVAFGGANDTRIFLSGNPNMPEYAFRSGLYDPSYWPENGFYKYPERVRGFSKQYDYLVVHREGGIHQITYSSSDTGTVSFPSKPINDEVGTIATQSIQIIENNPVFLSKDGVYMLTASNIRDERNVTHISLTVDRKLLLESGLDQAVSIDYDKKYWLAMNGMVYILDYAQKTDITPYGKWYIYDNIPSSCFLEKDGFLYFGSSKDGLVYRFHKENETGNSYNDDGAAINAYWKSKPLTFGTEEHYKTVDSLYIGLKPAGATSVRFSYETDKSQGGGRDVRTKVFDFNSIDFADFSLYTQAYDESFVIFNLFDFGNVDFNNFTFQFSPFPKELKKKLKAKRVTHFQLSVANDQMNESLTVLSLVLKYQILNFIR
ncbi:DUF2460 domain-containing protein [Neobacillus drentensis]|uniref:DUF2460 domain-containing protein n=1 Tax=Neobacillus drentensis TaxID=220684 RepID=UPI001F43F8A6|nr:DUF2460 domain-containing protein [Neobacillus drentensis]ULT55395.1 DUF2460 domain-containing protein [Neobacillus drentensis]